MTKELARNILVHFDDLVWRRDNGVTPGMVSEALDMAAAALDEPGMKGSAELTAAADADFAMLKEKGKEGEAVLHYHGFLDGYATGWTDRKAWEGQNGSAPQEEPAEMQLIKKTRGVRLDMSGLSVRATNWLGAYGIRTMEDLLRCTKKFIGRLQNIGKQTVAEIEEAVRAKGYELGTLPAIYVLGHTDFAITVYKTDDSEKHSFSSNNEAVEFIREENKKIRG